MQKAGNYMRKRRQGLAQQDLFYMVLDHLPTAKDQVSLAFAHGAQNVRVEMLLDSAVANRVAAIPDNMMHQDADRTWRNSIKICAEGITTLDTHETMSIPHSTWSAKTARLLKSANST